MRSLFAIPLVLLVLAGCDEGASPTATSAASDAIAVRADDGLTLAASDDQLVPLFADWTHGQQTSAEPTDADPFPETTTQTVPVSFESFSVMEVGTSAYLVAKGNLPDGACHTVARPLAVSASGLIGALEGAEGEPQAFGDGPTHTCTAQNGCRGCSFITENDEIQGCDCSEDGGPFPDREWCQHQISQVGVGN
jgi:hypothetical protein